MPTPPHILIPPSHEKTRARAAGIRRDLTLRGLVPQKRLGQHFLASEAALARIVEAAHLTPNDTVLEVGPGTGVLTRLLAAHARRVIAVEKDAALAAHLRETFAETPAVTIVTDDILRFNRVQAGLVHREFSVVANIPYYLTARLLRDFLESPCQPKMLVLLIQREVAERMTAKPPHTNILSCAVRRYGTPRIIARVPAGSFVPPPKVDSAIVSVELVRERSAEQDEKFFKNLRRVFKQPRRQLLGILSSSMDRSVAAILLKNLSIEANIRPEALSFGQIEELCISMG